MTNVGGTPGPVSGGSSAPLGAAELEELRHLRAEFSRFMLEHQFGIAAMETKIEILRLEFLHLHDHNPIEHVSTRLKTPESVIAKVARKGLDPTFEAIRASVTDIAGLRITCSFVSDVYGVAEMLTRQADVTVLATKDYVAEPKSNGYRSLHLLVQVPVYLSDAVVPVTVELQLRTVAMDFWASLEHKIHYKFDHQIPADVRDRLSRSAETAAELDTLMEDLHRQVHADAVATEDGSAPVVPADAVLQNLRRIREAKH